MLSLISTVTRFSASTTVDYRREFATYLPFKAQFEKVYDTVEHEERAFAARIEKE